jgi:hypothetical protein
MSAAAPRTKKPKVQVKREKTSLGFAYRIYIDGEYAGAGLSEASAREGAKRILAGQERKRRVKGAVKTLQCFLVGIAVATIGFPVTAETLKKEPAMGALKEGQVVFVDDGTCPAGQIKKVIGGNHVKAGGYKQIERIRACVAR